MDLGTKPSKMYDAPSSTKKYYPSCSLPAELFGSNYKPGDTAKLEVTVKIESMGKDSYYVEFTDGKECAKKKTSIVSDAA